MSRLSIVDLMFSKTEYRNYFKGETPTFFKGESKELFYRLSVTLTSNSIGSVKPEFLACGLCLLPLLIPPVLLPFPMRGDAETFSRKGFSGLLVENFILKILLSSAVKFKGSISWLCLVFLIRRLICRHCNPIRFSLRFYLLKNKLREENCHH